MAVTPFRIRLHHAVLDDLRARLEHTRIATPVGGGMPPVEVSAIVQHWLQRFDWRAREAALDTWPQVLVDLPDGTRMHAVHRRSDDPASRTILLSHGWPHSFVELLPLAELLPDFHVVVPSLPGYLYSDPMPDGVPFIPTTLADRLHDLMAALGYDRYLVYGEDVAASATDALAARHPKSVEGLFATHSYFPPNAEREGLTPVETEFFEWLDGVWDGATAYAYAQATRGDTLATALSDSPAGLAAWMIDKFREWSDPASPWRDDLDAQLTTVTLYWATNCIGSSFRPYVDGRKEESFGTVPVPAGVAVQTPEGRYPRELAERGYTNLRTFGRLERGGHFAAAEAPDEVERRLREFVATLD